MWTINITDVGDGSYRSLNGAADESIFQGRASKAGYYCFFKVWRDMPYDAVLDHDGNLYRIEVKGSKGRGFNLTRGSRSGQQIRKEPGVSRTRIIDRNDCDFVVGVDGNNGDCYIIPTDIIEILQRKNLSKTALLDFKEKWELFKFDTETSATSTRLNKKDTRDGLRGLTLTNLQQIVTNLSVQVPEDDIKIKGTRNLTISDEKEKIIFSIWKHLTDL